MQRFQRIVITGKPADPAVRETVDGLVEHLASPHRTIRVDAAVHGTKGPELSELIDEMDLLIVVGGDGTLLRAARQLLTTEIPILGVNRGRLGFLVDVAPDHFDEIEAVLNGQFIVDERLMLDASIRHGDQTIASCSALNEIVLQKWNTARMIEFETWIDGEFCNRHRSDGLIVCTPTGSTAYAMSGGGPILHPGLNAMALVPICPHTLSNRPLVIGAGSQVEVRVAPEEIEHVRISCDSQIDLTLTDEGRIAIAPSVHRLHLLHPPGYRYFDILRAKLRWGDGTPPC
ncbi:NAD(+) kinase [Spiribacter sp. C176]|uniref:NAD kinase n=1 Tax=Spiribacter salilacus TaxID=2664894 RepID=A0A6N7QL86_9GAMM|nr:NAD(+) kinase [Spiribacter salilacus]MRH77191.1 NAD(+) kinase [Spiribacter salilacus]